MTFEPGHTPAFLTLFERAALIRQQPGYHLLVLWQDAGQPALFCTHSHWESPATLDAYQRSGAAWAGVAGH